VVLHSNALSVSDVVALSPTNVWGAGPGLLGALEPVVVHWDGKALRRQTLAQREGQLNAIAAASARDIWAVGWVASHDDRRGTTARPLVVRWNGARWKVVSTPVRDEAEYTDVAAPSADDVWIVGRSSAGGTTRPVVVHWDGRRWTPADLRAIVPASSDLGAVDARRRNDVWAVGARNVDGSAHGWNDLVLHWDGRRWRRPRSPIHRFESGYYATAVDVAPRGDVWVAEETGSAPWFVRWPLRRRATPRLYQPRLGAVTASDIAAVSRSTLWIVGDAGDRAVVARWNGRTWRIEQTPFASLDATTLMGVSALSPKDIWAAGDHLLVRYSC
jgi:hypothetical protein